jgi:protein-L-isoaspartate(D-aspartate) O-methyltransferase
MIGAWIPLLAMAQAPVSPDPFVRERLRMVKEQIEARGVKNPAVLAALRDVPREQFMPPAARAHAYEDRPVSIGFGQTISQPYIVAFMTDLLDLKKHHRVLEIGTGSAYQAAILARLANEVYSIEIVPDLARSAAATLRRLGYRNVTVREGDGYQGWPEHAPFDRVILTAAPPALPPELVRQLKPGGLLIAPVGVGEQEVIVVQKHPDGSTTTRPVLPVSFVPMRPGRGEELP